MKEYGIRVTLEELFDSGFCLLKIFLKLKEIVIFKDQLSF